MNFDIETDRSKKKKQQRYKQKLYLLIICFLIVAFLILLITYIVLDSGNKNRKQIPTSTPKVIEKNKEDQEIKIYNDESNDRPIAFIIDNSVGNVNYAGLQSSYLNYEIMIDENETRIMSIYKDRNVNLIGPIQSLNNYFLDYALESDAILVHYGSSSKADQDIKDLNINNINGLDSKTPFRRDEKSKTSHNVFTNIEYIKDYLNNTEYSKTSSNWKLLNISQNDEKIENGENANKINIPYSKNEYRTYMYDETNKYYLRSQNGQAHIDRQTNKQLHYKNIIVLKADYTINESLELQELKTTGTGTGYYISNGNYNEITWSKETRNSKSIYKYKDGTELKINDGNTFIQIIPKEKNITIE